MLRRKIIGEKEEEGLVTHMNHSSKQEYQVTYTMLDSWISVKINQEDSINRNLAIYEGIEVQNLEGLPFYC